MNDSLGITFAFLAGLAAGMFFLWSLWSSVRRLPNSQNPALLMLTGFLVRMTVVLGVLGGLAMRGDWRWLVAAAIGFALIRTVGVRVIAQRPKFPAWGKQPVANWKSTPWESGMSGVQITADQWVIWQSETWPMVRINATLVFTWGLMLILVVGSWLVTRRLTSDTAIPRWQNLLEVLVTGMRDQIREVSHQDPGVYLPFVGTLFLFIAVANLLAIVPGYIPPTGSLSTTAAAGHLCLRCRADFWNRVARVRRISETVRPPNAIDATIQRHRRTVTHLGGWQCATET
ncbi:MAG: F0F1 ATP synthase subunit A [Pirellulaceae bacterium]